MPILHRLKRDTRTFVLAPLAYRGDYKSFGSDQDAYRHLRNIGHEGAGRLFKSIC
jgi:hypothetical protein